MRYHKTPSINRKQMMELNRRLENEQDPEKRDKIRLENPRAVYKQLDEDGHVIYTFDPLKDTTMDITVEEKQRLTLMMHQVDDAEVRQNCKELRLDKHGEKLAREARERFINKYREEYNEEPNSKDIPHLHRTYVYIDKEIKNPSGEKMPMSELPEIQSALSVDPFGTYDVSTPGDIVRAVQHIFTDRELQVYEICFREGMRAKEAAEVLHISEARISQLLSSIKNKLRGIPELRRFYRPQN